MRSRICAYLRGRRKGDWLNLLALYAILAQLVVGTVVVYAQQSTSLSDYRRMRSLETTVALTDAKVEQGHDDVINLRAQISALALVVSGLQDRLVVLEQVNQITSKILRLVYGIIATIGAGLVVAIINMRMQKGRRNEQVSKEDIRAMLAEINGGKS